MFELFSQEAEQSVLGAMLLRPELIDTLSSELTAEDFYYSENGEIYRAILKLRNENKKIDVLTVTERLGMIQLSNGETIDPLHYVGSIARNTPSVANAQAYADIVRERSVCREMVTIGQFANEVAYSQESTADKISLIQGKALALDSETTMHEVSHAGDVLVDHVEELQRRFDLGDTIDGLSTGNDDLDEKLGGLKGGELIVIAGRPAMGKTAFAMNIAEHAAIQQDKSVLVVSLEMTNNVLMDRLLASVGKIPLKEIKSGQVAANYSSELTVAVNKIHKSKLYLSDRPNINVMQLRSIARRQKLKHGLDLLVLDYLQLMQGTSKNENRVAEVSEMSRQCKLLARELNVPVIILSQLNRMLEQRGNKRPMLSDLRESGAIEQDADVIMFVYRDEVYSQDSKYKGIAEIILGKSRNSETCTVYTAFNGSISRFDMLTKGWQIPDDDPPPPSNFSNRYRKGG